MVTLDMQELYVGTLIVLGDNKRNGKECCCVYLGKEMCLCFREHMPIISQNTTQLIAPACQSSGQCRGGGASSSICLVHGCYPMCGEPQGDYVAKFDNRPAKFRDAFFKRGEKKSAAQRKK